MVGVHRFELWASSSRTTRSTKLSYTPDDDATSVGAEC
jgi:hypothetical protein